MRNDCLKSAIKLTQIERSGFCYRRSVYIMSKFRNVQFVVATAGSTLFLLEKSDEAAFLSRANQLQRRFAFATRVCEPTPISRYELSPLTVAGA